jgi:hypothetical protein
MFDGVIAIDQDFGLDDWDEAVLLTDGAVSSESLSCLIDGSIRRKTILFVNLNNSSPFGESTAQFVVFSTSITKSIKTGSGKFFVGATNFNGALVNLDTTDNASLIEEFTESCLTITASVTSSFVIHDDA